uniref:Uncharacterized protein n=1 Tax=Populus trichocarpa TaxID=3694 RepID=A0A2K1XGI9_POPTR
MHPENTSGCLRTLHTAHKISVLSKCSFEHSLGLDKWRDSQRHSGRLILKRDSQCRPGFSALFHLLMVVVML